MNKINYLSGDQWCAKTFITKIPNEGARITHFSDLESKAKNCYTDNELHY